MSTSLLRSRRTGSLLELAIAFLHDFVNAVFITFSLSMYSCSRAYCMISWHKADRHIMDLEFQIVDQVLLKISPYAQSSVANRPFSKLALKYYGPFLVLERVGATTYKLDHPSESLIHPIFHVSQLKPFRPDFTPVYSNLALRWICRLRLWNWSRCSIGVW